MAATRTVSSPPTDAQGPLRRVQRKDGDYFEHSTLAFSFRAPPTELSRAPEIEAQLAQQFEQEADRVEVYAFRDAATRRMLLLTVTSDPTSIDVTQRTSYLEGFLTGLVKASSPASQSMDRASYGLRIGQDDGNVHEYRLAVYGDRIYMIGLGTYGERTETLRPLAESLRTAPLPPLSAQHLDPMIDALTAHRWGWADQAGCAGNRESFHFAPDRDRMEIRTDKPYETYNGKIDNKAVYRVVAWEPRLIRLAMEGETRLDQNGQPIVWDLSFSESFDEWVWVRNDWLPGSSTKPHVRCAPP